MPNFSFFVFGPLGGISDAKSRFGTFNFGFCCKIAGGDPCVVFLRNFIGFKGQNARKNFNFWFLAFWGISGAKSMVRSGQSGQVRQVV